MSAYVCLLESLTECRNSKRTQQGLAFPRDAVARLLRGETAPAQGPAVVSLGQPPPPPPPEDRSRDEKEYADAEESLQMVAPGSWERILFPTEEVVVASVLRCQLNRCYGEIQIDPVLKFNFSRYPRLVASAAASETLRECLRSKSGVKKYNMKIEYLRALQKQHRRDQIQPSVNVRGSKQVRLHLLVGVLAGKLTVTFCFSPGKQK
jgi:hypothetical protein